MRHGFRSSPSRCNVSPCHISLGCGCLSCEDCGRDPSEIRRTLLMPCYLTEDKSLIERVLKGLGAGSVAGSKQYVIDRIGEFQDAGIAEIMFGGINSGDVDRLGMFEEEIVSAFR